MSARVIWFLGVCACESQPRPERPRHHPERSRAIRRIPSGPERSRAVPSGPEPSRAVPSGPERTRWHGPSQSGFRVMTDLQKSTNPTVPLPNPTFSEPWLLRRPWAAPLSLLFTPCRAPSRRLGHRRVLPPCLRASFQPVSPLIPSLHLKPQQMIRFTPLLSAASAGSSSAHQCPFTHQFITRRMRDSP